MNKIENDLIIVPKPENSSPITSTSSGSSGSGSKRNPLPLVTYREIKKHIHDPANVIWEEKVLTIGNEVTFIGAPEVGKSRLTMQAAICTVLGIPFLRWQTNGAGLRWLFIQSENDMDRLKHDMDRMLAGFSKEDQERVMDSIAFTDIGSESFEGICMKERDPNRDRIIDTLDTFQPNIVVVDPARDAGHADLNSDAGMTETLAAIKQVVKHGNPRRVPFVVHHGRTGADAARTVFGDNASSFGRNSKVMIGWTRSQINVAAAGEDWPGLVIFGCGKNSNGRRWREFAAQLDTDTMMYRVVEDFDCRAWQDGVSKGGKAATEKELPNPVEIANLIRREGGRVTGGENAPDGLVQRTRKAFGLTVAQAKAAIEDARGVTIQSVGGDRVGGKQQPLSYVLMDAA